MDFFVSFLRLSQKSKSINRRGHKVPIAIGISQRSQRAIYQCFAFAYFATTWRALRLKKTFETASTISNFCEHCFFNIICINVNNYFKILLPYLDFLLTAFTNFERSGRRIDHVSHLTKIISINIYRRTIGIVERQVWDDSSP